MDDRTGILLHQHEGNPLWVLGDLYRFKLTGKQTNGALTVIEQIIQPQSGPPPHIHRAEDEAFYILEGRFSFLCGDKESVFETGSFIYIPKGTAHTFKNIDAKPGRLLATVTPAGLEEFFYAIGTVGDSLDTPVKFDPSDIEKILSLAENYKMVILAPDTR